MNTWEKEPEYSAEIGIRHGDYHPLDLAHPPRALPGIAGGDRVAVRNTALLQFPDAGSRVLPLLPEDGPKTAPDPIMERTEAVGTLRDPIVVPPAAQILVKFEDNLVNAPAAAATGQLPHPILESLDGFGMDADARIAPFAGEAEAEKAHPPRMGDPAFLFIHLQLQLAGDEPRYALHYSPCGSFAANEDDEIVRIADKAQPALFKLFVKLVEHNI